MTTKRRQKLPTGMRYKRASIQACVRVRGVLTTKTFAGDTALAVIQQWIDAQRDDSHGGPSAPDGSPTFANDVATYLDRKPVQRMPTFEQRAAHLHLWLHVLGRDRAATSITTEHIDDVILGWLDGTIPPPPRDPDQRHGRPAVGRAKKATVRKRCVSLQSFFRDMYPRVLNPVSRAAKPKAPKHPEVRGLSFVDIERALATMPDYRSTRRGAPRVPSLAKIVAGMLAYSGIPPGLLNKLEPHDLALRPQLPDYPHGWVRIAEGRDKGEGVEPTTLPLTADAVPWFKRFHEAHGYHRVPATANRSWKRALTRVGIVGRRVCLYDSRHSYLTQQYRVTRDLATVARLALHAEGSPMTARYARAADVDVNAAAVVAFSASLAEQRQALIKPLGSVSSATSARTRSRSTLAERPARRALSAVPRAELPAKVARSR